MTQTFVDKNEHTQSLNLVFGGELVSFYAPEPDLAAAFLKEFPEAKQARSEAEILEDKSIHLVVSASIPNERAPLGVRVNAISPGEIDTAILSPGTKEFADREVPMRRLGRPDEVADAIFYLCSERASYVNGAELHINGGQHV